MDYMSKQYSALDNMISLGDIGIIDVYPFAHLEGSPLQREKWQMRLLNAGELLEVLSIVRGISGRITDDETQLQKTEMFIRSVVTRNGRYLVDKEAIEAYNKDNGREDNPASHLELARIGVRNLEQFILNTWDLEYARLLQKQENFIMGYIVCKHCGQKLPRSEKDLPKIEQFDSVAHCPFCPDRDEVIQQLAQEMKERSEKYAETLGQDIDLEEDV